MLLARVSVKGWSGINCKIIGCLFAVTERNEKLTVELNEK